jgi:hypothetical protein
MMIRMPWLTSSARRNRRRFKTGMGTTWSSASRSTEFRSGYGCGLGAAVGGVGHVRP